MTAEREAAIRALHNLDLDALRLGWGGDDATHQRIDAIGYLSALVGELRQERNRQATALDAVRELAKVIDALPTIWGHLVMDTDEDQLLLDRAVAVTVAAHRGLRAALAAADDGGTSGRRTAADRPHGLSGAREGIQGDGRGTELNALRDARREAGNAKSITDLERWFQLDQAVRAYIVSVRR